MFIWHWLCRARYYKSVMDDKAKKKICYVALTRPKSENWVGRSIFFFFTYRERVEFSNIFLKVSKWGKTRAEMQSKRIYKCFFKPLNKNFSKFFAQIWHFQQQKTKKTKKTRPCFFAFYGRSGEGNITIFWGGLRLVTLPGAAGPFRGLLGATAFSPPRFLTSCSNQTLENYAYDLIILYATD